MKFYIADAGMVHHIAVRSLLMASLATALAAAAVPARGFGPGNCVSVTRTDGGTCMLTTNCTAQDVSSFDFSFLCVKRPAGQEIHSLGVGSFDQVEEFDTEVSCDQCLPPIVTSAVKLAVGAPPRRSTAKVVTAARTQVPVLKGRAQLANEARKRSTASVKMPSHQKTQLGARGTKGQAPRKLPSPQTSQLGAGGQAKKASQLGVSRPGKKAASFLEKDSLAARDPSLENLESDGDDSQPDIPEKAEHYGPASCVAVWRNDTTGHCVMQTDCDQPAALSIYEFGLVCVDQGDEMTKHVFGTDSFKLKERFDTLIECQECLALDEYTNGDKAIKQLAKEVQEMEGDLMTVGQGVTRLNAEVMKESAAAPAPALAAVEGAEEAKEETEAAGEEAADEEAEDTKGEEEAAAADAEAEESTGEAEEKEETGTAAVGFLKQARHQHKHQEVRQVRRRHVEVKKEDVSRADDATKEAAVNTAFGSQRLDADDTGSIAAEAEASDSAEIGSQERFESGVDAEEGSQAEAAADSEEQDEAEGSSPDAASQESGDDAVSRDRVEERADEDSERGD
mmetsp:Transcript_105047/g.186102  ORF Transcript_105047/g.186102 Transcript_105047/m.186102 type:complete len:566 (-) Transcript_105047:79-1776(-)